MGKVRVIGIFLLYLIFGLYFVNSAFSFINIPDAFLEFDKWIIFVGGILILIGGINYFRARKKSVLSSK